MTILPTGNDVMDATDRGSAQDLPAAQNRIHNLENALQSSRIIGIAIGIVMERNKLDSTAAFNVLVQASQRANLKVRDLAEQLVYTGEMR